SRAERDGTIESLAEERRGREELEAELAATRGELDRAMNSRAEEERRREEVAAELRVGRDRAMKSRAKEQRRRRELEAELAVTHEDLKRLQATGRDPDPQAGKGTPKGAYDQLVEEIRARALDLIPSGATVLVASKGDEKLLRLNDRQGWHFPSGPDGRYLGYHPAGDTAVIAQLEAMRASGADHLLVP